MGSLARTLVVLGLLWAPAAWAVTLPFPTGWTGDVSSADVLANDSALKTAVDTIEASYIASSALNTFTELVAQVSITGTCNSTTFVRGDGSCQTIAGGGDALTTSPLSQFAATTSAQLAGVLSNETGSGAAVFATSPTLVTPELGVATATSVTTGVCVLDTNGLTCAANATAGQFIRIYEDTDLGTSYFEIALGTTNLSGNVSHAPAADGTLNAATLLTGDTATGDQIASSYAGRSLTETAGSPDVLDADAELYTDAKCVNIDPTAATTDWFMWRAPHAITITGIDCIVDAATSVVLTPRECDANGGTCADIEAAITCATTNTTEATSVDNASVDAGDWIRLTRGTTTGSPTQATLCLEYTKND